jgi:hypothetical protein
MKTKHKLYLVLPNVIGKVVIMLQLALHCLTVYKLQHERSLSAEESVADKMSDTEIKIKGICIITQIVLGTKWTLLQQISISRFHGSTGSINCKIN